MLSTEELSSTLTEALFHYREVLTIRENERGDELPQKGKLPATDDDDLIQHAYHVQLEAINRFLSNVDDMVGALVKPNNEKSVVKFQEQAPANFQPWAEPYGYQEDEPFINPFTGKLVEVPSSSSSKPGPSTREGPLKDTPSFWENYEGYPSLPLEYTEYSAPGPQKLIEGSSSSATYTKNEETHRSDPSNTKDHVDSTVEDTGTPHEVNIYGERVKPIRAPSLGVGTIARENDISLPGTWVHSWTAPPDDEPTNYFKKPTFPATSNLSRTKSRILEATNSWGLGWMPRAPVTSATAIQLEEIQDKSQDGLENPKSTASSVFISAEESFASDGTHSDSSPSVSVKEKDRQLDAKGENTRWKTAPEQQELEATSTTYRSPGASSHNTKSKESRESTKDTAPISISPPFIPPIDFDAPKYSPASASSSGVSSAAGAGVWNMSEDEEKAILDFDSSSDDGVPIHLSRQRVPKKTPKKRPKFNSKAQQPPKYSARSQSPDQIAKDAALAERLASFEADFQKASDLFEDLDQGFSDPPPKPNQDQGGVDLPDLVAMGYDPETLALIAELADGTPQDYNAYFEQEIANEALIAELAKDSSQDFNAVQDWELAMKLAEDSPQDMDDYIQQLKAQEEFARQAQEIWDEDIRRRDREEIERIAAIARREAAEERERIRKERMATCTVCLEEGEKEDMVLLSCTHWYCTGCIKLAFESAMGEKKPFRCCDQVPIASIAQHFTPDFVAEYDLLVLELVTPNPLYCGMRGCSKFIPPRNIQGDTGTCPTCRNGTCRHCRASTHTGICPADTESAAVIDLARKNGWKPCPGCQHMIERTEGCLHMTCSRCRAEFCYNCGKPYNVCAAVCKR